MLGKVGEHSWADRVRNEVLGGKVQEERNILQTVKGGKAKLFGHML